MLLSSTAPFQRKRRVARLMCHEVFHQWFGNLVTPYSFDDLWVKEGLARYFEYIAVDSIYPSYRVCTNFITEVS
jgi:aminopeptidase N